MELCFLISVGTLNCLKMAFDMDVFIHIPDQCILCMSQHMTGNYSLTSSKWFRGAGVDSPKCLLLVYTNYGCR